MCAAVMMSGEMWRWWWSFWTLGSGVAALQMRGHAPSSSGRTMAGLEQIAAVEAFGMDMLVNVERGVESAVVLR